jgi:hypothetical protein
MNLSEGTYHVAIAEALDGENMFRATMVDETGKPTVTTKETYKTRLDAVNGLKNSYWDAKDRLSSTLVRFNGRKNW